MNAASTVNPTFRDTPPTTPTKGLSQSGREHVPDAIPTPSLGLQGKKNKKQSLLLCGREDGDSRVLRWLCVRDETVVDTRPVAEAVVEVVCSGVHIWVESWRTVGLAGDGLDVAEPALTLVLCAAAVVVAKPDGPRPLRCPGFRGVTWLPEAPPPLGFVVVLVAVERVLPLATATVLAAASPPSTVGVTAAAVVVVVSALLGIPLGLDRKIGSWPIRLASTRSVGT